MVMSLTCVVNMEAINFIQGTRTERGWYSWKNMLLLSPAWAVRSVNACFVFNDDSFFGRVGGLDGVAEVGHSWRVRCLKGFWEETE